MDTRQIAQLINFLHEDLAIPNQDLQFALRHSEQIPQQLPMVLWQYGFLTLTQLEQIFDWLDGKFYPSAVSIADKKTI